MAAAAAQEDAPGFERIKTDVDRLSDEFAGVFSRETVMRCALESFEALKGARIAEFVPVLVYRFTRERLRAQAQVEGSVKKLMPEILFVCVHNAGRSQMAAVLADRLSGGRVHVRSAGSTPANEINPRVVEAMSELGMDLSQEFPKPLTDDVVQAADVVITMGCGDACPIFPGKRYLDWQVDDPAGQPIEMVRRIRDDIAGRVTTLLAEMGVD
jgi:protein-tyrosine-phosphatase